MYIDASFNNNQKRYSIFNPHIFRGQKQSKQLPIQFRPSVTYVLDHSGINSSFQKKERIEKKNTRRFSTKRHKIFSVDESSKQYQTIQQFQIQRFKNQDLKSSIKRKNRIFSVSSHKQNINTSQTIALRGQQKPIADYSFQTININQQDLYANQRKEATCLSQPKRGKGQAFIMPPSEFSMRLKQLRLSKRLGRLSSKGPNGIKNIKEIPVSKRQFEIDSFRLKPKQV